MWYRACGARARAWRPAGSLPRSQPRPGARAELEPPQETSQTMPSRRLLRGHDVCAYCRRSHQIALWVQGTPVLALPPPVAQENYITSAHARAEGMHFRAGWCVPHPSAGRSGPPATALSYAVSPTIGLHTVTGAALAVPDPARPLRTRVLSTRRSGQAGTAGRTHLLGHTASRRRHLDRSSPLTGSCGRHRMGGGERHDRKRPRCQGGNYCTRDRRHRPPRRALQRTAAHMARPPSMPVRAAPARLCPVPNKKSRITHVATLPNSMTA